MAHVTLRVVNIDPIVTEDGDLIVAGTPGTVISWDRTGGATDQVSVKWDAYLYPGDPEGDVNKQDTASGLIWETSYKNLKYNKG